VPFQTDSNNRDYNGIYNRIIVVVLSVVCLAVGILFVYQGISKNAWLIDSIKQEKITLGLTPEEIQSGKVLQSAGDLQKAGDTIRGHRHAIAPTYQDALGGKQYDPTNPKEATYAQGMNLENSLYLGVLSFGVTQMALGAGVFMILVAVALGAMGIVIWRISGRRETA
jgi:hypothetical protein